MAVVKTRGQWEGLGWKEKEKTKEKGKKKEWKKGKIMVAQQELVGLGRADLGGGRLVVFFSLLHGGGLVEGVGR